MRSFLFAQFARYARVRAIVLAAIGLVTLLFPQVLRVGMFYIVCGYLILSGFGRIADHFLRHKRGDSLESTLSLGLACVQLLSAGVVLVSYRDLLPVAPLVLGAFMLIKLAVYFAVARFADTPFQRNLLSVLAVVALLGVVVIVFPVFGFAAGGALGVLRASSVVLILFAAFEIAAHGLYRPLERVLEMRLS